MPIQGIRNRAPILGKIRLGEKKTSQSGAEYPTTTSYFILKSLPQDYRDTIERIYGREPREIDIMFPSDNEEQIIPTWYKWYSGGTKNSKGEVIGGRLRCYGDGPDENDNPGKAVYLEKMDSLTRKAPTRPCLGRGCPDYFDGKNRQQCWPSMKVLAMLPLVSMYGVFEIDTKSWNSIASFHSQIQFVKAMNGGVVKGLMFKICRVETVTNFVDPRTGDQKTGKQYILELHPNENFALKHGEDVMRKLHATFKNNNLILPPAEELLMRPSGDAFALEAASEEDEEDAVQAAAINTAEAVVADPLVQEAFRQLEEVTGKHFTEKTRLISVRKKEGAPDLRAAILDTIQEQIATAQRQKALQDMPLVAEAMPPEVMPPEPVPETAQEVM